MKKIFILIVIMLCLILIMLSSLLLYKTEEEVIIPKDYSEIILSNSSWITLDNSDFNSLLLNTYSDKILTIINSLENSIPIIIEVHGGQFSKENRNNFIVASAFDASNNVYSYIPTDESYEKITTSLEILLENAVSFLVINDEEVLK